MVVNQKRLGKRLPGFKIVQYKWIDIKGENYDYHYFPQMALRDSESGATTFEIAQSISNALLRKPWLVKQRQTHRYHFATEDGSIEIVTLWPRRRFGYLCVTKPSFTLFASYSSSLLWDSLANPVIQTVSNRYGHTAGQISNEDLPRIEEEMKKIVKENFPSIRAKKWQRMKHEKFSRTTLTS